MDVATKQSRLMQLYNTLVIKGEVKCQKDFAEKIGVNRATLSSAMNGQEKYLTRGLLNKIKQAYPWVNIYYIEDGMGALYSDPRMAVDYDILDLPEEQPQKDAPSDPETLAQALEIIKKNEEQIDRLLAIIEKLTNAL